MIPLPSLGWRPELAEHLPAGTVPARVARVDRGRLAVLTGDGERRVHLGAGLYADPALGGPAVGDWVALRDELAVALLPRTSAFVRTAAGRTSTAQVVAANLDVVLVVDALTADPRLRRVERYLAVAWSSGATPVVVLTKADLCDDVAAGVEAVREDALGVEVLAVSSWTGEGLDAVRELLGPGRTAAMVGPSGVGKSSLLNALAGDAVAGTREIREDGRGRHTTTARELHLLPGGALLVDTPGMRELALHDDAAGVEATYADVVRAGRRLPVPRLRPRRRARVRGGRRHRRRPARPGPLPRLAQAAGRGAPPAAARGRPRPGGGAGPAALAAPRDARPAQPPPVSPRR